MYEIVEPFFTKNKFVVQIANIEGNDFIIKTVRPDKLHKKNDF